MKFRYIGWLFLCLFALFAAVSCKSTPPVEEEIPVTESPAAETPSVSETETPAPPDEASLAALDAAAARAASSRKLVSDFDGAALFPADWRAADSLYSEAEQLRSAATLQDANESAARYNSAADAFDAMSAGTFTQYYENRKRQLESARAAAVDAGANVLAPDFLLAADNAVLDAWEKYSASDYYAARDGTDEAAAMYAALKSGLDAYAVREEITGMAFTTYDPQNFALADEALGGAISDYSAERYTAAGEKAEFAFLRYNIVLRAAWQAYAAEKNAEASALRQTALDEKANVAVRQDFNSAQTIYARANALLAAGDYSEAVSSYEESGSMFEVIAELARQKRIAAEDALDRANQRMIESDETARNAEVILEGGIE